VLPLLTVRRRLGALHFASSMQQAYTLMDIDFMQIVARQVAVTLENVLNHESAAAFQQNLALERDHRRQPLAAKGAAGHQLGGWESARRRDSPRHEKVKQLKLM
jgi:formate hydrogenlyase transcriptional activator